MSALMSSYNQYDARHVMPAVGGWMDQTTHFQACVQLIDRLRGTWRKVIQAAEENKRRKSHG